MSQEKYQPSPEEIAKEEEMMTPDQKGRSETREAQLEQFNVFVDVLKSNPDIYEELMHGVKSPRLVAEIAKNMHTEDGLVYVTAEETPHTLEQIARHYDGAIKRVREYEYSAPHEAETAKTERVPQGNIRVWIKKPKADGPDSPFQGHFDKGSNPNLVANAYASVEDIRKELENLKKDTEVVSEEDYTGNSYYIKKSTLLILKHKPDAKQRSRF